MIFALDQANQLARKFSLVNTPFVIVRLPMLLKRTKRLIDDFTNISWRFTLARVLAGG